MFCSPYQWVWNDKANFQDTLCLNYSVLSASLSFASNEIKVISRTVALTDNMHHKCVFISIVHHYIVRQKRRAVEIFLPVSRCKSSVTNPTDKHDVLLLFTGICRTLPRYTHSTHTHLSAEMLLLNLSRTSLPCSDARLLWAFVCSVWRTCMLHFSYEPNIVLILSATWLLFALFNLLFLYRWSLFSCKGYGYFKLLGTVRSRSAKNKWVTGSGSLELGVSGEKDRTCSQTQTAYRTTLFAQTWKHSFFPAVLLNRSGFAVSLQ